MSRKKKERRIYLDYATTTPLDPKVERVMKPLFTKDFGNPHSIHWEGVVAKKVLLEARTKIARSIGARSDEIIFNSGGTEGNNLAIFGAVEAARRDGIPYEKMHAITTIIEHASVLECFRELERRGVSVTYLQVNADGILELQIFKKALRTNTVLVSVMYVNNEIGTVQPIREISKMIHDSRFMIHESPHGKSHPIFHVDACQAAQYFNCDRERLGADIITFDGHKMYGPKGIGALFVRHGTSLQPILFGGGQEMGIRPGTESVALIAGLSEAFSLAVSKRDSETKRLLGLRDFMISEIEERFPEAILNGSRSERSPNNINFSFPGVNTEFLTLKLDSAGVSVSTKSACNEGERESYVVSALGGGAPRAAATLRFSLGRGTTKRDIIAVIKLLEKFIN